MPYWKNFKLARCQDSVCALRVFPAMYIGGKTLYLRLLQGPLPGP